MASFSALTTLCGSSLRLPWMVVRPCSSVVARGVGGSSSFATVSVGKIGTRTGDPPGIFGLPGVASPAAVWPDWESLVSPEEFTLPWTDFGRLKSFEDGVVVEGFGAAVDTTTGVVVELASRWEGFATPKGIRNGVTMVVVELVDPGGRGGVVLAYCLVGRETCEVVDPGGPVGGVPKMKDGGEVQKWEVREVTQEGGLEHDNMNKKKRGASEVPEGVKADGVGGEFPDPIMG